MQGCCYVSSVHTTASNLSLDDEERGDGATESVHAGCGVKGKAVRALLWTTRTGDQESKMSGLTLKLPEKMQGRAVIPDWGRGWLLAVRHLCVYIPAASHGKCTESGTSEQM